MGMSISIWCFFTTRGIKRQVLSVVLGQLFESVVVVFLLIALVDDAVLGGNVDQVASTSPADALTQVSLKFGVCRAR